MATITENEATLIKAGVPKEAAAAVMVKSETMPEGSKHVKGYDFNDGVDFDKLMASYATHGFQASNLGKAIMRSSV